MYSLYYFSTLPRSAGMKKPVVNDWLFQFLKLAGITARKGIKSISIPVRTKKNLSFIGFLT
jgi:hypothetical protein